MEPVWLIAKLAIGTRFVSEEVTVSTRFDGAVSTSAIVKLTVCAVSSGTHWLGMSLMEGGSLMGRTWTVKVRTIWLFDAPWSSRRTVKSTSPFLLDCGPKRKVPFDMDWVYKITGFGMMLVSDDSAVRASVCGSLGGPALMPVNSTLNGPESSSM